MIFTEDEDVISYFTEGQCAALAWELYKLKGYTLALISSDPVGSPSYYGHVFVIDSDGKAIDIKGHREIEDIKEEWYFCSYLHRFFTVKDFKYEMQGWNMRPRFDRDLKAKSWARKIYHMLDW